MCGRSVCAMHTACMHTRESGSPTHSHHEQHVAVVAEDLGIRVVELEGLCCRLLILDRPLGLSHASLWCVVSDCVRV